MSPTANTSLATEKKAPAESTLSYYRKNLKDKDSSIRQEACKSLGYMSERAKAAVPDLIRLVLYDASSSVKTSAIEALRSINTSSKEAVESFLKALKNENPHVREAAAKALGNISPASKDIIKALISTLKDKELKVRVYSMQSLLLLDERLYGHIIPLLQFTLVNRDEEVRTAAFNTVMSLDSLPGEILSFLIQILYEEFDLIEEKSFKDHTEKSEVPEIRYQILERTIKALVHFENKGQPVISTIINYNKPEKKIYTVSAELWLKEDTSLKGIDFVVALLKYDNIDTSIKYQVAQRGSAIIPILKKHLQQNPVQKVWVVEPLLILDSTIKPQLIQMIVKASELKVSEEDEFKFWWEVINILKKYNLSNSKLNAVLTKLYFKDKTGRSWNGLIKEPFLQILLNNLRKDSNTVVPVITEIINGCNSKFYCRALEMCMQHKPQIENKSIIEALWSRKLRSEIVCEVEDVFKLQALKANIGLLTLDNLISWFNELNAKVQLSLIEHLVYNTQYDPKIIVPVFIEALGKSTDHQSIAAEGLEKIGRGAIQSVPYLKKAKEATSDINLKVKIEDAIRIIEDK